MSYDINFWKQQRSLSLGAEEIYGRLCSGEEVEGLTLLPVDTILARLKERFPAFDPTQEFPDVQLEEGNIEFIWSNFHFRFDFRGDVPAADRNAIVEIMRSFGCPMYDPQVNKRYDAADGTEVGETEMFVDLTPSQKEEVAKLKADMMAMFTSKPRKSGCAGPAALFVVSLGVLTWEVARRVLANS